MARKVFVSFLGTNNYLLTKYQIGEYISKPVRFIQEALVDYLCPDWSEEDKILIFYTDTSYKANWVDNGQERISSDIEKIGLHSILTSKDFKPTLVGKEIKEGFSEEDVWDIFETVYEEIQENDEIYLDVTHAFRSIPLFSAVLFNFSKFMKGTNIKSVHYGAFEKMGSIKTVLNIPEEDRLAPVVEMSGIIRLQELTSIASDMVKYGKMGNLSTIVSLGKKSKLNTVLSKVKKGLTEMESCIVTNRQSELMGNLIPEVRAQLEELMTSDTLNGPEKEILRKMADNLSGFEMDNKIHNILAAIHWAVDYNMVPQAYTLGQEFLLSLLYDEFNEKYNFYHSENAERNRIKFRTFISNALGLRDDDIASGNYEADDKEVMEELLKEEKIIYLRSHGYATIAQNRNIVNHGKKTQQNLDQLRDAFVKKFSECLKIFGLEF